MCDIPIQYKRDFILEIKSGERNSPIKNKTFIEKIITHDFFENLKTIEKLSIDNIPTHTTYKNKGSNFKKIKNIIEIKIDLPQKDPQPF